MKFRKSESRSVGVIHTVASISFTIWLVGFFGYQLGGWFFTFLAFALIAGLLMLRRKKKIPPVTGESAEK
jgi:hypothetical protein